MRVLHIGKYYPPYFGGIEKVNFDLVESLNAFGIPTDVLCFNHTSGTQIDNDRYKVIRCSRLLKAFSTPISWAIFKQLKLIHKEYDIIHIHLPNPVAAIALQTIAFKGKIVLHWHSDIVNQKKLKYLYAPFQNAILKRADKIIVTSTNYLNASIDLKPYRSKCQVIPIGIDHAEFLSNELTAAELSERYAGRKVVFSLGRLIYYKGFEYLIEAACSLPDDYIILIGGVGKLLPQLEKQIKDLNVDNKVKLLGKIPVDELAAYYQLANIFCLPSNERSEAYGVVLVEAMSFGCPIIACDIPGSGVTWVVNHGRNGIIVPVNDAMKLAFAIQEIMETEDMAGNFREQSLLRYRTIFSKEQMISSLIHLYKELV